MELKNRIAYAPMLTLWANPDDGSVSERHMRWYEERVKGGIGFAMTEAVGAYPTMTGGMEGFASLYLGENENIPCFAKLAELFHSHDVKVGMQIAEAGETGALAVMLDPEYEVLLPSMLPQSDVATAFKTMPFFPPVKMKEVTTEEIEGIEEAFAAAARRAKQAGFDCVEIHSAHGTLHSTFLSPRFNKRTDKYGGSWENRTRFTVETIERVREAVGDFPIFVRISADELLGELGITGITINDTVRIIAPRLEAAGVDCIDVSAGLVAQTTYGITVPLYLPRGCWIPYAEAVKKAVNIPVIGVGNINDLRLAEKHIEEGKVDIIYLGRQIICDPETPKKYMEGRFEDIRMCIGCLEGPCTTCAINFDAGKEGEFPITPAEKPKKVLVAGGGVAGMEAARIAALRGHEVILCEKSQKLGGLVLVAAAEPIKVELKNIVDYLEAQIRKLLVKVKLEVEVTPEVVQKLKPDAVIIATGSSPKIPSVASGKPNVITQDDLFKGKAKLGDKIVVWGLGLGAETAVSLAKKGKKVTIIGSEMHLALHLMTVVGRRLWILNKVKQLGINVLSETRVEDITAGDVTVIDKGGGRRTIPADTVVIAVGRKPNRDLIEALKGRVPELHEIGDCSMPRNIASAIRGANEVARKI